MYKNLIINYMNKLKKEDIYTFIENNDIEITKSDIDTIYKYIKTYNKKILEDPEKYIEMIKKEVDKNTYNEIVNYYEKYKKNI